MVGVCMLHVRQQGARRCLKSPHHHGAMFVLPFLLNLWSDMEDNDIPLSAMIRSNVIARKTATIIQKKTKNLRDSFQYKRLGVGNKKRVFLMNFGPIDPFLSVKCRGMYMST
jgi:hypothetical protein